MSSKKSDRPKRNAKKQLSLSLIIGIIFVLIALVIPLKTFAPVIKSEINYQINKKNPERVEGIEPTPVDQNFSLVIPKINANTKVIGNIDPFNSQIYQPALTQGVAHASTSDTPDRPGNVFIFAHSAGSWYQANQYNAVFYLLNKLNSGDEIFVYYHNQKYTYLVNEVKTVDSKKTDYLNRNFGQHQLTLMTCWPPGTTLKRLLVTATLKND
jgi:sortase A